MSQQEFTFGMVQLSPGVDGVHISVGRQWQPQMESISKEIDSDSQGEEPFFQYNSNYQEIGLIRFAIVVCYLFTGTAVAELRCAALNQMLEEFTATQCKIRLRQMSTKSMSGTTNHRMIGIQIELRICQMRSILNSQQVASSFSEFAGFIQKTLKANN
jgi:hypothetical protein